jgi:hypothetical protein
MAAAAKQAIPAPAGVLYGGWLADSAAPARLAAAGHLGLPELLAAPAVDFVVFPAEAGQDPRTVAPLASLQMRGKPFALRLASADVAAAATAAATCAATLIAPGDLASTERRPPPEPAVAAVVDAQSAAYLAPSSGLAADLLAGQLRELSASGLAFEVVDLAEVVAIRAPEAPTVMYLNAFVLDQSQRELLRTLEAAGRTLVYCYADGAMRPTSGVSGRDVFALAGIAVTSLTGRGRLQVAPTPGLDPFTRQVPDGTVYGTTGAVTPWFRVVDENAEPLGKLPGGTAIGLAARRGENAVVVYSAAPCLPAALLRSLAAMAGQRR